MAITISNHASVFPGSVTPIIWPQWQHLSRGRIIVRYTSIREEYCAWLTAQPVDAFQGALPPSQVQAFVDKVAALGPEAEDGGLDDAVEAAEQMLAEGAVVDAAQTFAAILGEAPEHTAAYAGLIKAHVALGETDRANELLDTVPAAISDDALIAAVRAQLELAEQAAEAGETAELRAKLDANPDDHQARLDLAIALQAAGDAQAAIDELLELFRRDREWNEEAAKTQLIKVFESLGPTDPLVATGRRKLSSMIFA